MKFALLAIVSILAIVLSVVYAERKHSHGMPAKRAMKVNIATFLVLVLIVIACAVPAFAANNTATAAAATTTTAAAATTKDNSKSMGFIAAAVVTSLAGLGGGIAIAASAPAAIGATSEDPKVFGKALIFVALGEAIALYGVIISILILNKI